MSVPAFIETTNKGILGTGEISYLTVENNELSFRLHDGSIWRETFASSALALNAYDAYRILLDSIGIGGVTLMNGPIFDVVNYSPGLLTPPDIARGCLWFGAGGTFYSWNPGTATWLGVIIQ